MAYLKMGFVKKDVGNKGNMSANDFKLVMKSILKNIKDEKETFDIIL
jgi:hypothetical protein